MDLFGVIHVEAISIQELPLLKMGQRDDVISEAVFSRLRIRSTAS